VWAFQKVNHLKRTTRVGPGVWNALNAPRQPRVLVRKAPADRVEIDLRHQLLTVYRHRRVVLISHISSGSGRLFCSEGRCRYAVTSTGDFRTGRRARGWETGPLGSLFNPIYFNGGIAMHGALDVPPHPASHGCVRVPMHTARILPRLVGTGERVYVRRPH
jgi:L,D-transpeptidase-like protein